MRRLRLPSDPRWFQIAVLGSLLVHGVAALDFEVRGATAVVILATALAAQAVADRLGGRRFEPKSALISALSLCLLLRTGSPLLAAAAAALAIGSKPLIRIGGKHVFNPSNLGLVAVVVASERAWVSPGQWGSAALGAFAFVGLGSLVVRRAERSDVTWAFLASWVAVIFGRAAWLGDPLAIPLHQLSSGSLLLFAFHMISDPKTTPDSRPGRVLYAVLVAAVGAWIVFGFQRSEGPIFALVACSPLVPLIDRLLPGSKYRWAKARSANAAPAPEPSPVRGPWPSAGTPPSKTPAKPPATSPTTSPATSPARPVPALVPSTES